MYRIVKKLAALCLALTMTAGIVPQVSLAAGISGHGTQEAVPFTLYVRDKDCRLSISGQTANVEATVSGYPGEATECEVRVELQRKISSVAWTRVDSWTDRQKGYQAAISETASVIPGETYRAKATVTVWAGSKSETLTIYS